MCAPARITLPVASGAVAGTGHEKRTAYPSAPSCHCQQNTVHQEHKDAQCNDSSGNQQHGVHGSATGLQAIEPAAKAPS